jgi:hypothetical protein
MDTWRQKAQRAMVIPKRTMENQPAPILLNRDTTLPIAEPDMRKTSLGSRSKPLDARPEPHGVMISKWAIQLIPLTGAIPLVKGHLMKRK